MFIERQHRPAIEFDQDAGQQSPTLVHYFSDRAAPFKTVLPLLVEGIGQDEERVLVITSPLNEIVDETIRLNRDQAFADLVVVDQVQQPFFDAIRQSLLEAIAKLERIQYVRTDDEPEDD